MALSLASHSVVGDQDSGALSKGQIRRCCKGKFMKMLWKFP